MPRTQTMTTLEHAKNSGPTFLKSALLPYVYQIEPTNHCPYTCIMCPRGRGEMTRALGHMAPSTVTRVLEQMAGNGQRLLRLHHFGESVLAPELPTMVSMVDDAGLIPLLSVNPSSLSDDMARRLIEAGIGIMCFSLDSMNDAGLHEIRGIRRSVEKCLATIEHFVMLSEKTDRPILTVVQMVELTHNATEREAFLSLEKRFGQKRVSIYLAENTGFGSADLVEQTAGRKPAGSGGCTAPFHEVVVLWNGDIVPCCYDFDGANVLGNILKQDLHEIWHGELAAGMRHEFINGSIHDRPLCRTCHSAPEGGGGEWMASVEGRGLREEAVILDLLEHRFSG